MAASTGTRARAGADDDRHLGGRGPDGLSIELAAVPENLPVLCGAAAGVAETVGLPAVGTAQLREVVSEASTNAIDFAYAGAPRGGLVLSITATENGGEPAELSISVRDRGRRNSDPGHSDARFGLASLRGFARSFEIASDAAGCSVGAVIGAAEQVEDEVGSVPDPACTEIHFARLDFVPTVLPRVLAAHARRAGATVVAIAEAMVLADAFGRISPRLLEVEGGSPTFKVAARERAGGRDALVIEIGPLAATRCEEIVAGLRRAIGTRPVSPLECSTVGEGDQLFANIVMAPAESA